MASQAQRLAKSLGCCRSLSLALWVGLAAACAPADSLGPPGSLVVAFEATPTTLDPRYATDEKSSLIGDLLYQGLTRLDEHGEPVLDLAASVRIVDRRRYVFRLRPGFRFHGPARAAGTCRYRA